MLALLAAPLLWSTAQAAAPSFDCGRARTRIERAMCKSPDLAKLDRVIAERYRKLLPVLSPAGRAALRDGQRRFVRELEAVCVAAGRRAYEPQTFPTCLKQALDERAATLPKAVARAGGHLFLQTDWRYARQVPDEAPNVGNTFVLTRTIVHIDAPAAAGRRWNQAIEKRVQAVESLTLPGERYADYRKADFAGQIGTEVTVTAASQKIISARIDGWGYYGGAHGQSQSATLIWSLARGRAIANNEIFDPHSRALVELVGARYGLQGEQRGCNAPELTDAKLTVDRSGLRFSFDPYELGGYTCGGEARISWEEAAPYLRTPLPFDPGALASPVPLLPMPSAADHLR